MYARLGYLWVTAAAGPTNEARMELDRALDDPLVGGDPELLLRCLVAKAASERVVNEASARTTWERIRDVAKEIGDKRWQARALAELGEITYMDGDVGTAVGMFKQAILSQFSHGDFGAAIHYASIVGNGLVEAGQSENGLRYCSLAIRIASLFKDAGFPFLAYQGKARALIALNRRTGALPVLQEALEHARTQKNRYSETQLLIVAGVGAEHPDRAIHYLKAANALSDAGGFYHAFAWSAMELAKVYHNAGNLPAAETYADRGLAAMEDLEDKYHLPQHVALLADLKSARGKFEEANRLYERATDLIDALLVSAPSPQIQSSLISTLSGVYLGHFEVAAARLGDTGKAYEIIEQARGRALADELRGERKSAPSTHPLILSAQKQINLIQRTLLHETNRAKRQELLERLFETEQILVPVADPSTPLRTVATRSKPVQLAGLQSHLLPDEAVLEYVLAEPRSFCLVITRDGADVHTLRDSRRHIEQTVEEHLVEIRARKTAVEVGQRLHAMLLRPVLSRINKPRLIVVPDGNLNFLPFDSLVDPDGQRVVASHIVSYSPSGTVLSLVRTSQVPRVPGFRFLGVGNVEYAQAGRGAAVDGRKSGNVQITNFLSLQPDRLGDVPNTVDEIMSASRAIGGQGKLLLGPDATEAAVKSQPLDNFEVVHFATHGVSSAEFPDRAALVLAPDAQGREDGLLQAREIRNLTLRAQLVTLSACETGFGSLQGQEGVSNLLRAFLFAGSRSVVASLWPASDTFTTHLMTRFYGFLARGDDPSLALQRAKAVAIQEFGDNAVPFLWAGFVLVGDGSRCIVSSKRQFPEGEVQHDRAPGAGQRQPVSSGAL